MQAGILAAAGIICKVIGILYRSPLAAVIGDEGNGYYSSAYEIYTIILLVSSYSIPSAISKVIAQRLALREYRNAQKIFRCAIGYVVVVGGLASLFTFFGAGILVGGNSVPVLRIFAPTIFFSGLLGVLRGYFQAHGTMVPTSFSQIVEQILNAVVSILAAFLLIKAVAGKDTTTQAVFGASGSAIGTGAGVLIALLFMFGIFLLNREYINQKTKRDRSSQLLTTGEVYKIIITMVTPVILSTFIYNCNTSLNLTIYTRIMEHVKGFSEVEAYTQYGLFSGKAKQIANIPIAIASAMSSAMIPGISGSFAQGDIAGTNRRIGTAIKTTMFLSIPSAVGLAVLAKPVTLLLYPQKASVDMVSWLLAALSISVVFYALSTISNAAPGDRQGESARSQCGGCPGNPDCGSGSAAAGDGSGTFFPGHRHRALFSFNVHTQRLFRKEGTEIQAGDNKDLPASRLVRSDYGGGGLRRVSWPVFADPY